MGGAWRETSSRELLSLCHPPREEDEEAEVSRSLASAIGNYHLNLSSLGTLNPLIPFILTCLASSQSPVVSSNYGNQLSTSSFSALFFSSLSNISLFFPFRSTSLALVMKSSGGSKSPSQKPQSIRSRAGSTPGLDSKQIHSLINRNNKFTRILCKDADTVDSPTPTLPPTRSSSVISIVSTSSADTVVSAGRLIKVAPAKVRHSKSASRWQGFCQSHDTVSIVSDESESVETPRSQISVSHVNFYKADRDSPEPISPSAISSVLSPTSSDTSDPPDEEKPSSPPTPTPTTDIAPRSTPLRSLFLDEIVWQIDENVFAAAIDAVNNNSLMCRLNIEFICEIADESADHVQESRRQNRGFDCPCFCNRASSHFRYYLSFSLPETEQRCMQLSEDTKLNDMFDGFIDLVQRAQRANRNVLVCSTRGRNRAPAFASAYLMHKEQIPRQAAVAKVRKAMGTMRPPVNISDFMQRKLMRYQQHLGIDLSNAYDPAHTLPLFHVKRSAWT